MGQLGLILKRRILRDRLFLSLPSLILDRSTFSATTAVGILLTLQLSKVE